MKRKVIAVKSDYKLNTDEEKGYITSWPIWAIKRLISHYLDLFHEIFG